MYEQTDKFNQLTSDDVLYKIDCFCERFLDLTENEHLKTRTLGGVVILSRGWPHHLGYLLLILVLLLLLASICLGGCGLLSWCHIWRLGDTDSTHTLQSDHGLMYNIPTVYTSYLMWYKKNKHSEPT
jgi:hypothetical protein